MWSIVDWLWILIRWFSKSTTIPTTPTTERTTVSIACIRFYFLFCWSICYAMGLWNVFQIIIYIIKRMRTNLSNSISLSLAFSFAPSFRFIPFLFFSSLCARCLCRSRVFARCFWHRSPFSYGFIRWMNYVPTHSVRNRSISCCT